MTIDEVLDMLAGHGLIPYLDDQGHPRIRGPTVALTEATRDLIYEHREAILCRLKIPTRRVVLLTNGRSSPVEKVLSQADPREHHLLTQKLGREHPGRYVAAEWRQIRPSGEEVWHRFLVMRFPEA